MRDLIRERLHGTLLPGDAEPDDPDSGGFSDLTLDQGDDYFTEIENFRPAAVLIPLVDRPGEMTVLLTQRPDYMKKHAGQIAFPGGGIDDTDTNAVAAALREAQEEVGLHADHVEVVGRLDPYRTGTGYQIAPIVGIVQPHFELRICEIEVAEAFEVPLSFLMNPENRRRHQGEFKGKKREYYSMPYEDYFIWGATAGMLVNLAKRLYG